MQSLATVEMNLLSQGVEKPITAEMIAAVLSKLAQSAEPLALCA